MGASCWCSCQRHTVIRHDKAMSSGASSYKFVETRRNLWWQNEVLLPRARPVVAKRGLAPLHGDYQRQVSHFKIFILQCRDEYL